jgi:hypothetical protein
MPSSWHPVRTVGRPRKVGKPVSGESSVQELRKAIQSTWLLSRIAKLPGENAETGGESLTTTYSGHSVYAT